MNHEALSVTKTGLQKLIVGGPGPNEIKLKTIAFGVNRLDLELMKSGAVQVSGIEVSGEVIELGDQVSNFKLGDLVMSLLSQGGFSEYVNAPAGTSILIPKHLDPVHAAALPEALFTAWFNLFEIGKLKETETVLIQGASGAIGMHAALMTQAMGIKTLVSVGRAQNVKLMQDLGFENVYCTADLDWPKHMQQKFPLGVDVILDVLGPKAFGDYFDVLAKGGRIIMIDSILGDVSSIDVGLIFSKNISVTGSLLRPQTLSVKEMVRDQLVKNVIPLIESNKLRPVMGHEFMGLEMAEKVFQAYQSREYFGKILVKLNTHKV